MAKLNFLVHVKLIMVVTKMLKPNWQNGTLAFHKQWRNKRIDHSRKECSQKLCHKLKASNSLLSLLFLRPYTFFLEQYSHTMMVFVPFSEPPHRRQKHNFYYRRRIFIIALLTTKTKNRTGSVFSTYCLRAQENISWN